MKQFLKKTILVQDADNPSSQVYKMVVVDALEDFTYKIIDVGAVDVLNVASMPGLLREWMDRNALTQEALSKVLNVHQSTISYWLSGRRPLSAAMRKMIEGTDKRIIGTRAKLRELQDLEDTAKKVVEKIQELKVNEL